MFQSGLASRLPQQRWQIAPLQTEQAQTLSQALHLNPLLAQVLINRGVGTPEAAQIFLNPELQQLPSPLEEFEDLPIALELLLRAIADRQYIAICGDYDADGMTSTALLLRALRGLGAIVDYAIPSRMQEGYGINRRIIEEFHEEGVGLILTVDNGIAAHEPIALARELGIAVIVTDHHDIPPTLPNANAILNPKLIRKDSPYQGVAGVGVAYILAVCLAQSLQKMQALTTPLIELFTLGTIADLAPLTGVNRRWVKRGLKLLPKSKIPGIQALIQVAGLSNEKALKPEAIGFRLGPRINAIGRLSDPQIVIELLTTDDDGRALELAMKCEQVNQLRQRLCELIEQEAVAWCRETGFNPQRSRVLVIVQPDWHHGVIGIVASRLVERYGVPVFIGTFEDPNEKVTEGITEEEITEENPVAKQFETDHEEIEKARENPNQPSAMKLRGSARGIPEFNVFDALHFCGDLLEKFGGHKAAGGFTLLAENLDAFRSRLEEFAAETLRPEYLKPLVTIDVEANFADITFDLYEQLDVLHPCGIENSDPVFWTSDVQVLEQRTIGRDRTHLKVMLASVDGTHLQALAWRWGEYYPLPDRVNVAYRVRLNEWNGVQSVELELLGIQPLTATASPEPLTLARTESADAPKPIVKMPLAQSNPENQGSERSNSNPRNEARQDVLAADISCFDFDLGKSYAYANEHSSEHAALDIEFYYSSRKYTGQIYRHATGRELRISNLEGQLLIVQPEQRRGFLGQTGAATQEIDVTQPHYFNLVRSALMALEIAEKNQLIREKDALLVEKDTQIWQLQQQLTRLQQSVDHALDPPLDVSMDSQSEELSLPELSVAAEYFDNPSASNSAELLSELLPEILPELNPEVNLEVNLTEVTQDFLEPTSPEPIAPSILSTDPKTRLLTELGNTWQQLDSRSHKDLIAAYKKLFALQSEMAVDYSDVGLRLCSVIEREVIQLFFKELHQFFLENDEPCQIGGVSLRPRKKYTLGMLPPLLAAEWQSFQEELLSNATVNLTDELYVAIPAQVDAEDRETIQIFLFQWEHPLALWLQKPVAASMIAQADKLLTIAADPENPLYEWQFQLLHQLIIGTVQQTGILRQIYL